VTFTKESKQTRILRALRNGAETAADVEADLDFALTRHLIAGHLSNLRKAGRVRKVGEARVPADRRPGGGGCVYQVTIKAYRYAVVETQEMSK
jgi:hypothetical protein